MMCESAPYSEYSSLASLSPDESVVSLSTALYLSMGGIRCCQHVYISFMCRYAWITGNTSTVADIASTWRLHGLRRTKYM
jgi:hypothetical protein